MRGHSGGALAGALAYVLMWIGWGAAPAAAHGGQPHHVARLSWTDWQWDPLVLASLAAASAVWWVTRRPADEPARQRAAGASRRQLALYHLGLLLVVAALESPLDRGADHFLFTLHMAQHMLLSMAAAPLLVLGAPPALWVWLLRRRWLGPVVAALARPGVAAALYNAALALWHLPGPYEAALRSEMVHAAQHLSFLATGVLFWAVLLEPAPCLVRATPGQRLAVVGASAVWNWLISFALATSSQMLYPTYAAAPRLWGLSPQADLALGAGLMWEHGNMVYALAALWLLRRDVLRPEQPHTCGSSLPSSAVQPADIAG